MNDRDPIEQALFVRSRIRGTLRPWAEEALRDTGFRPAAHHLYLLSELEGLSGGDYDRLMILMPPGSAKSTYASVVFPAWWFSQHPHSAIIGASHSRSLAEHFSRRIRGLILEKQHYLGFRVSQDHRAVDMWATSGGGEDPSVGVRGAITGRRADLVIIDDPVKSQADAESGRQREHIWDWYKSDVTTRLKPGGKVVLIMTRWHPDDLGGQLLGQSKAEWRVVRLPAFAEAGDPLGRSIGDPLWPEWESHDALTRKRELIGERAWSALFQQIRYLLTIGCFLSIASLSSNRSVMPKQPFEHGIWLRQGALVGMIRIGR